MKNYTFPFNSCEVPYVTGIAQPYSTTINACLCGIIFYFLFYSNNVYSQMFLSSVFVFNVFHTFSHLKHLKTWHQYQFLLTHYSAVISTIFLILLMAKITNSNLQQWQLFLLVVIYFFDTYLIVQKVSNIYNIVIFLILLFLIMLFHYSLLSNEMQQSVLNLIGFASLVLLFQLIEIYNCDNILEKHNNFPFHVVTEISACIPIYLLCRTFFKL